MVRLAMVAGFVCLLTGPATAGQASAGFTAGITIGDAGTRATQTIVRAKRYTWGAASISVSRAGFDEPQRMEKSGALYWFKARRGAAAFRIAVSVSSGQVVKVIPA